MGQSPYESNLGSMTPARGMMTPARGDMTPMHGMATPLRESAWNPASATPMHAPAWQEEANVRASLYCPPPSLPQLLASPLLASPSPPSSHTQASVPHRQAFLPVGDRDAPVFHGSSTGWRLKRRTLSRSGIPHVNAAN